MRSLLFDAAAVVSGAIQTGAEGVTHAVQVELVPSTDAQEVPEKVANTSYYYRDSYGPGTFKTCRFSAESGQFFESDSTIRRKGPEGVQAYCRFLEKKME